MSSPEASSVSCHGGLPWWFFGLALSWAAAGCSSGDLQDRQPPATSQRSTNPLADNQAVINQAAEDQAGNASADAEPGNEWQAQLAAVQGGESESIRIFRQVIGSRELAELHSVRDRLTELLLDAGRVDDAGLAEIAELPKLEHLRIRGGEITDAGLATLAAGDLQDLRIINLPYANITADGIARLSDLPALVQLRLGGAGIDDRAMVELAQLPQLRSLHLIAPTLTEHALDSLAGSPKLTSFYLDDCPLPDAAWERLFAAKPGLHVHIDQAHHDRDPNHHPHP